MYAVTDATGRTGAAVARRLLRKGERVRVIGRGGERLKSLGAEGGELSDADLTDRAAQPERGYADYRAAIGADLRYVQASDDEVRRALLQLGISANVADLFLEMAAAWNSGHIRALEPRAPGNTTPTSYETFVAEEFLPRFEGKSTAA